MAAIRRKSVLGLAVLLAAATAVADTVVTAKEVISCWVVSAGADSVRLTLTQGQSKTLPAWDVYEVRLSDSIRVAELAGLLPRARVILDSGQSVPPPEVRVREAMRLRLDRAREALVRGLSEDTAIVETVSPGASSDEMAARCREMDATLRVCGRSDRTVARLLHEVNREAEGLAKIPPEAATYFICIPCGGLLGGSIAAGLASIPEFPFGREKTTSEILGAAAVGVLVGAAVGVIPSLALGPSADKALRTDKIKRHRVRVNDLIRRVNRAVAPAQ